MGNKSKLLEYIVPVIEARFPKGSCVCDLMAGTNSVAYALKDNYRLITNDIEAYSKVISDAIICNKEILDFRAAEQQIHAYYLKNMEEMKFDFFFKNYSNKYFSPEQCMEIDSIRYGIENLEFGKSVLLSALMYAMNLAQSTPGHFAQFLPESNNRVKKLRDISIYNSFKKKAIELSQIPPSKYNNLSFAQDYIDLFRLDLINEVDVFYIDTPYTIEQYSRFYHVLNTIVKYDDPVLEHKAGYRNDRYKSNFSYKTKAEVEFERMIKKISDIKKDIVLSYSNKGVVSIDFLLEIFKKYYDVVNVQILSYSHSTQGKGSVGVKEIIISTF